VSDLTEIVIYRCALISFIVWFFLAEWMHAKQIDRAYKDGYRAAIRKRIPEMKAAVDHFFAEFETDLRWIAEAVLKDESRNAQTTGTQRVSEDASDADEKADAKRSE
jgi:hypothetical protein